RGRAAPPRACRPAGAAGGADADPLRPGPVEPRLLPRSVPGSADRVGGARGSAPADRRGRRGRVPGRRLPPGPTAVGRPVRRVGPADDLVAQPARAAPGAAAPRTAAPAGRLARRVARRARSCSGRSSAYHEIAATVVATGATTTNAPSGD